jgi:hypothetical protein
MYSPCLGEGSCGEHLLGVLAPVVGGWLENGAREASHEGRDATYRRMRACDAEWRGSRQEQLRLCSQERREVAIYALIEAVLKGGF